jgi:hypothetical protein
VQFTPRKILRYFFFTIDSKNKSKFSDSSDATAVELSDIQTAEATGGLHPMHGP